MKTEILLIVIIIGIIFFSGCSRCLSHPGRAEYLELTKIPQTDEKERLEKFLSHSVEMQIDIYLYASGCQRNPSVTNLVNISGEPKIPDIIERIRNSSTEDKSYLIRTLMFINGKCLCINQEQINVLAHLKPSVNSSDSPGEKFYKESYADDLNSISEQTGKR
jgi:hypothetical protein